MQLDDVKMKNHADHELVANILDWFESRTTFISNLKRLHEHTLRAYAMMLGYFRSKNEVNDDILVFTSNDLARIIYGNADVLVTQSNTLSHLIDIIEIQIQIDKSDEFVEKCGKHLIEAVHSQKENAVDVHLQVTERLNASLPNGIPLALQKAVIESLHGQWLNEKVFAEALILIDGALKRYKDADEYYTEDATANNECVKLIWSKLCGHNHQCDKCYTILAQLIGSFMSCCRTNAEFANEFLSDQLWTMLRRGMVSTELFMRKRSNCVLRAVLQLANDRSEYSKFFVGNQSTNFTSEYFTSVWDSFFNVLDTLLDIQGHLIVSTLERYLGDIVKLLPARWYSIIFSLLFTHTVISVVRYGITFVFDHKIQFDKEDDVNESLHNALNTTALYAEESSVFVEKMSEYITNNNRNRELELIAKIDWKSVPGWVMLKSLAISFNRNPPDHGVNVSALMSFIEAFIQTKKHKEMAGINEMIVDIVHSVGSNRIPLVQMLILYEHTQCVELLGEIAQPLAMDTFEVVLIPSTKISPATKVEYFNFALTDAREQSNFLDEFYERKQGDHSVTGYSDCEYILFACMCNEEGLSNALQVFKSRLFDLIPRKDDVTFDALRFGIELLCFIVTRYLPIADGNAEIYKCIQDTFNSFHDIVRNRMYSGRTASNEAMLYQRVHVICAKLVMCSELHPVRIDVLAILTNAILIEDYDLDLHRFSHSNAEDRQLIQNLLDWYLYSEAKTAKPVHRAKILASMLQKFPNLRCDAHKIFQMLLDGKCDIKCIFDSTHPSCIDEFDTLLVKALLYGPELKGDDRIEYEFNAAISNRLTYVQQVRLAAMRFIRRENSIKQIRNLKNLFLERKNEFYKVRYFNKSHHHSLKLRYTQALAFLFRLDPIWDNRTLDFILNEANQTNVKYICELIVADTIDPKQLFPIVEKFESNRGYASMFQIMYYICCKHGDRAFTTECIDFLHKFLFVKQISIRSSAQNTLVKLCDKFRLVESYQLIYDGIRSSLAVNAVPRFAKLSFLSDIRTEFIDCQNLLHPVYVYREFPRLTHMNTDEFYKNSDLCDDLDENQISNIPLNANPLSDLLDIRDSDITFIEKLDDAVVECGPHTQNVQKKMVPVRETFIERKLIDNLPPDFQNALKSVDSGLIVVASLVSKIPNLGGICRSSEVFGVSRVVIDNEQSTKRSEFTSLSMGSEKWLQFKEMKSHYLSSFLIHLKSQGYCIVGAEQTASGKYLHNATLPHKMVLLLGHEKDGIPAHLINLLDLAIEIPQLGVIRSLNVHVTSALFTWEYCKQHLLSNADVSR